jgi:hypothetical protein
MGFDYRQDHYVVYRAYLSDPIKRLRVVCTLVPRGHFLSWLQKKTLKVLLKCGLQSNTMLIPLFALPRSESLFHSG